MNALAASPSPLRAVAAGASATTIYNGRPLTGLVVTDNYLDVLGVACCSDVRCPSGPPLEQTVASMAVSPAYFPLLRIELTPGRLFTETEAAERAPLVVVSRATAERFWPGVDPIRQTLDIRPSRRTRGSSLPRAECTLSA